MFEYGTIERDGSVREVSIYQAGAAFEKDPKVHFSEGGRGVGRTILEDGTLISTIFIGINSGQGWFETMVFLRYGDNKWEESYTDRYETAEQAMAGHAKAVDWAKEDAKSRTGE